MPELFLALDRTMQKPSLRAYPLRPLLSARACERARVRNAKTANVMRSQKKDAHKRFSHVCIYWGSTVFNDKYVDELAGHEAGPFIGSFARAT
jgi:hypothetical protein